MQTNRGGSWIYMDDRREWPKISIATASFNQGQDLEEAIRSVLRQDYPKLEYFVIDGRSMDDSVAIIVPTYRTSALA
jgi:glycosyltransferase involved in cell wall biosynthesis